MDANAILQNLPYTEPFLFVDALHNINEDGVEGSYTFKKDADYYRGHFKDVPVTPGVLLTECCAQIGVVCLGIHLLGAEPAKGLEVALTSSEMEFLKPVFPGEKVHVTSEKVYFRFRKLKCKVKMYDSQGALVCKGSIAGMFKTKRDE